MRQDFNLAKQDYAEDFKSYSRKVSAISVVVAIIILVASLTFLSRIKMIADGILLGGVFTTIYSIIRGLMSEDTKFRFLIVTIGLLVVLILGYMRFIQPRENLDRK